jgi:hypothetical protein
MVPADAAVAESAAASSQSAPIVIPPPAQPLTPQHPIAAPTGFGRALAMSLAIAVAGIVAWAVLAEVAHVRTALIAFAVAAGVAAVMGRFAPDDRRAPATIVILTVVSALVGLLASQYVLVADTAHVSVTTALSRIPVSKIPKLMTTGTTAITWIIIAVSAYTGFGYAQRHASARRAATPAGTTPPV